MTTLYGYRPITRSPLLDMLGVPEDGTIVTSPAARLRNPHLDVSGGPGFFDVAGELIEMDVDELAELMDPEDRRPVRRRASAAPARSCLARLIEAAREIDGEEATEAVLGFLPDEPEEAWLLASADLYFSDEVIEAAREDFSHPGEVEKPTGPGAVGGPRYRGAWAEFMARSEATLGRSDAGSTGDVDLPDAEVGESLVWKRLEEITSGGSRGDRRHANGGTELREGSSRSHAHARRLSEAAERVCSCSGGANAAEERKPGCGGVCRMAERHRDRHAPAAGLRDWAGDLS